jgi:oxidoreductase
MNSRIPLALFGAGWVVRAGYLSYLMQGPFDVVSIYDPNPKMVEELLPFLPHARVETSEQSCFESSARAALIASPSPTHIELSLRALRAGLYVLCEKPVAIRKSQVQELIRAEQDSSKRLAGAVVCRHRPDVQQWIRWSAQLNEIREINLAWIRAQGVPFPGSWHTKSSDGWTGVLADLGYHLADLAVAVLNRPINSVHCRSATMTSSGRGGGASWYGPNMPVEYNVNDRVEAVLEFDEVVIKLQVSWVDSLPGDVTQLAVTGNNEKVELKGLFGFSTQRRIAEQQCRLVRDGRVIEEKNFQPGPQLHREAFGGVLEDFANVCRGAEPQVGLSQIFATTALIEALN